MLIPHKGPEFRSHFLRRSKVVALVVYPLRKSINCCLSARPLPSSPVSSALDHVFQASTATFNASPRISSTRRSFSLTNSGAVLIL